MCRNIRFDDFLGEWGKIMQPSFDFMHRFSTSLVSKNKKPSY